MTQPSVSDVSIRGLHGSRTINLSLQPGLNVVHGHNGTGKTTLLHVLANLAGRDLERFCHLRFEEIVVRTSHKSTIRLTQTRSPERTAVSVSLNGEHLCTVASGGAVPQMVRRTIGEHLGGKPVYLPAFRSILEAIHGRHELSGRGDSQFIETIRQELTEEAKGDPRRRFVHTESAETIAEKTHLCRSWFGAFVPLIRTPSLNEISRQLSRELEQAKFAVAEGDYATLSDVFVRTFEATVSESAPEPNESVTALLNDVQELLASFSSTRPGSSDRSDIYSIISAHLRRPYAIRDTETRLKRILFVYREALKDRARAQEEAYRQIHVFEKSANEFLENKTMNVKGGLAKGRGVWGRENVYPIFLGEDKRQHGLSVLSSGERQVVTLLFAATHMTPLDGLVLIDEPELSLHIDWQRMILTELAKQASDRQIIACTHSPEIAADHRDCLIQISGAEDLTHAQDELFEASNPSSEDEDAE